MQHMNLLLGEWVGLVKHSFLSYCYVSYYDIGVYLLYFVFHIWTMINSFNTIGI